SLAHTFSKPSLVPAPLAAFVRNTSNRDFGFHRDNVDEQVWTRRVEGQQFSSLSTRPPRFSFGWARLWGVFSRRFGLPVPIPLLSSGAHPRLEKCSSSRSPHHLFRIPSGDGQTELANH